MTNSLIDYPNQTSVRAWLRRMRRVIVLAAAGLLATGSFLLWGPVGLGNGPLSTGLNYQQGSVHAGGPVGLAIPTALLEMLI